MRDMTSASALVWLFLRQEVVFQHKGELLGRLWLLLQPLVYIVIFMTIFSQIMGMKLSAVMPTQLPTDYAYSIYLISGLLVWQLFANSLQTLSGVYQQKAAIIRKIPVSLTWLPLYVPLVELVPYTIGMLLFSLYLLFLGQLPTWQHLWLLPIVVLLLMLSYSLGLIVAVISVFIPDVRRAMTLFIQLMFWGTPIVYVAQILPDWAMWLVMLNPAYWAIENIQAIYLQYNMPLVKLGYLLLVDVVLLITAIRLVKRLEADVRDLL
jgi:lipopolysaccharide transport system permease protein